MFKGALAIGIGVKSKELSMIKVIMNKSKEQGIEYDQGDHE